MVQNKKLYYIIYLYILDRFHFKYGNKRHKSMGYYVYLWFLATPGIFPGSQGDRVRGPFSGFLEYGHPS